MMSRTLKIYSLLVVSLFLLVPTLMFSQRMTDGFYCEVNERRCRYNKVKIINTKKKVCILDEPLITVDEIIWVGEPIIDTQNSRRTIKIKLSEKGTTKLAAISEINFGNNLAFVLGSKVICLLKLNGPKRIGEITVEEDVKESTLEYVYNKLKASIER